VVVLAMAVAVWGPLAASDARGQGCKACGGDMFCAEVPSGAHFCLGTGDACLMGGRCRPGGAGPYYDGGYSMVQLTVLDDAPGLGGIGGARVVRGAGPLGVGRSAAAIARTAAGGAAAEPAIVFSGVGTGEGATAAFRSRLGDGFTLRREADGRGARVTVRALFGGRPGPVLARERLGELDALAVRVTLDGRPRVLVVLAPTLTAGEGEAREREARLALRGANGARPGQHEPPFQLAMVEE
jgi:hypothetical protein